MTRSPNVESIAVYRRRLESKAAKRAIDKICGDDRTVADRLRAFAAGLPIGWQSAYDETLPERRRRQKRLARVITRAAAELAADPEYSHLSLIELRDLHACPPGRPDPDYQLHFLTSRTTNRPTCAEVLAQVADQVSKPRSSDDFLLPNRRGMELKPYCLLALHYRLASWPKFKNRRPPHRQVEVLVGALLKQRIPSDTLTHVLGPNARRKYTKDSEQD